MIHFSSGSEYDRASEVVQESAESMNWIEDAVTILRERDRETERENFGWPKMKFVYKISCQNVSLNLL